MRTMLVTQATIAAFAAVVLISIACADDAEETVPSDSTIPPTAATSMPPTAAAACREPANGEILWRWGSVTFVTPDLLTPEAGKDQIVVRRESAGPDLIPPDGGRIVFLRIGASEAFVDAHSGKVVLRYPDGVNDGGIDAILASVCIDPIPKNELPWPYHADEPAQAKEHSHGLAFWRPTPDSGLVLNRGCPGAAGSGDTPGAGCFLVLSNGVSTIAVDEATGEVIPSSVNVQDGDSDAFDRWVDSIERAP